MNVDTAWSAAGGSHARRKFNDARNADAAAATAAPAHIRLLYDVKDEAMKRFEPHARTAARFSSGESSAGPHTRS